MRLRDVGFGLEVQRILPGAPMLSILPCTVRGFKVQGLGVQGLGV